LSQATIARAGDTKRSRESLKQRLDLVMAGAPIHHAHVNIGARSSCEAFEKIGNQFCLQIADARGADFCLNYGDCAAAEVDRCETESFIHGHEKIAGAQNAAPIAQCPVERLAQTDADIFDGVMLINIEVARSGKFQVKTAMTREQFQHVVEESNSRGHFVLATALDG
jgi:hypothetical protein